MTGLPIKDFDKLLAKLDSMNQTWTAIYDLLKPVSEETELEMPIPLNVSLFLATGTKLGEDIPFGTFVNNFSNWESLLRNTIDSDQNLTGPGYKLAYLKSYNPGNTYTFNIQISNTFTDFNLSVANPIQVFLIDTNLQQLAINFALAYAADFGVTNLADAIPNFIGYAKYKGWIKNLPPTGGSFDITPGNSERFLHFCVHTTNNGGQGCVISDYNPTNQTFTIAGY